MITLSKSRIANLLVTAALAAAIAIPAPAMAGSKAPRNLFFFGAAANAIKQVLNRTHHSSHRAPVYADSGLDKAQILDVQSSLRQAGYYSGAIDGLWGVHSRSAVVNWQQDHDYKGTGILTDAQLQQLMGIQTGVMSTSGNVPSQTIRTESLYTHLVSLHPEQLRQLQSDLQFLGYYDGPVDGAWGAQSQSALDVFRLSSPALARPPHALPDALDVASIAISAREREDEIARELQLQMASSDR